MGASRQPRHQVVQPIEETYRLIPLTRGQTAIVDAEDYEQLSQFAWIALKARTSEGFYAIRNPWNPERKRNCMIQMHRTITGAKKGEDVDHINHNMLDNRRANLRIVTRSENQRNRGPQKNNKSGVPGVFFEVRRRRWQANIKLHNRKYYLGLFAKKEDAIAARRQAELKMFGPFAYSPPSS